ncbi:toll-like receptor 4 [Mercenaria mercenaria]|uniref:toll-like receptor 4 n=1 Tax=Mercenaria mercenaria TaxID=6596 RepID=UPI001E1DD5DF|nr:toll-like receptor 4 [Mercenaria mercenaria]XP_045182464.1 toll-like receptor 4 [Mercenaria mercenaria]
MAFRITTCKLSTAIAVLCIFCLNRSLQTCVNSYTDTTICDNIIPESLPAKVTRVYININKKINMSLSVIYFNNASFADRSWRNVTFLDITAQYSDDHGHFTVRFGNMCFSSLNELKELRIHGDEIKKDSFSTDTFHGIHLVELQFSVCRKLEINDLLADLLHVNITVDSLSLNDVSTVGVNKLNINTAFYSLIQQMKVNSLNLQKTYFNMYFIKHWQKEPKYVGLKTLDISQSTMNLPSGTNINELYDFAALFLKDLKTLNISLIPVQFFDTNSDFLKNKNITKCDDLNHDLMKILFFRIENLFADEIFSDPVIINNTLLNISDCVFNLKKWHFRGNQIQIFNITVYLPVLNEMNEIDLSYNEIKYFSPMVTKTTKSLEKINLKSNRLFEMEYLPEFNDLLETLNILKYFNIGENKLSHLPQDIFRNNVGLEIIDLADNKLTTIEFNLKHLKMLKLLNIARNRIKFLDGKALANVQLFLKTRASAGGNNTAVIEITENPFICSCESVEFMKLIISFVQHHTRKKYLCKMENEETEINEDSLYHSNYSCYKTAVILSASVSSFVIIVVSILLTKFILRRKKIKREKYERKLFLKDFQKGVLTEQYLCQISYSSEDEVCALDIIRTNLNIALSGKCRCKREIICTGDKNFCLGRPIVNEILRCISKSCVVVFVISKSFCGSRWCEMELREAYEMDKPIILIFKETVETSLMPELLFTIFNRMTRAKLVEEEGEYSLIPDWESLGESIIKLAAEQFIAKQSIDQKFIESQYSN